MKKLILTLLLLITVSAQATPVSLEKVGTFEFLRYPSDWLGLGTSTPQAKLDVYDNNTAGCSPAIRLGGNNGGDSDAWFCRQNDNDSTNDDFLTLGSSSSTSQFVLALATGNVGIGTTSPSVPLAVVGSSTITSLNASACDVMADSVGGLYCGTNGSGGGSGTSTPFNYNGINTFFSTSTSLLGLGTTTPNARLNILGTDVTTSGLFVRRVSTNANPATLRYYKARGTVGAETIVAASDEVFRVEGYAYNGTTDTNVGQIAMLAETVSGTDIGGSMRFSTANASGTATTRLTINNLGTAAFTGAITGASTLTLTSGLITSGYIQFSGSANTIFDQNANELLEFTKTASAVNNFNLSNAVTGSNPILAATGTDSNISIILAPKGTGGVTIGTTSAATRLLYVQGDVSGGIATFERSTSATNVAAGTVFIKARSTGDMTDGFGPAFQFNLQDNASADNNIANISALRSGNDTSGRLVFQTADTGSVVERMTILPNGNVGIGIASPQQLLQLTTSATTTAQPFGLNGSGTTDGKTPLYILNSSVVTGAKSGLQFGTVQGYSYGGIFGNLTVASGNSVGDITFDMRNATTSTSLTEVMRITSGGFVGIGTASPSAKLTLSGSSVSGDLVVTNTSGAGSISLASLLASSATGDTYFTVGRALTSANSALVGFSSVGATNKYAFLTTYGRPASDFAVNSTGNVGIGIAEPVRRLHVGTANANEYIRISSDSRSYDIGVGANSSGDDFFTIFDANATANRIVIDTSGNVGIGANTPLSKFSVLSSGTQLTAADALGVSGNFEATTPTGQNSTLSITGNNTVAADIGGVLGFGGNYTGGAHANWASIKGLKTDGTSGNYGGYLAFFTRPNGGTSAERLRILEGGNIGIGTTTPANLFTIASTTGANLFSVNAGGHIVTGGGIPAVSSCGTSPSISGNDTAGTVTVGTGVVTTCTITFSRVRSNTPRVVGVVTGGGLNVTGGYSSKSTTAVTFSFAATIAAGTFDYYIVE